ncbi:hypothetical protein ALC57_00165 [Trachymyrmex cornetzi]|uniref:Tesmin/TSO1-like CXC domain-containing protein n=1 Tax=Trachymyrmex cornetzi TaxID=471704 RepID=A0A151K333_9HYME|nr:hypothetical protein ALC57_00165 [Trachymyrmex cornetzi]
MLFETSVINDPEQFQINGDRFVQFIFDNADHNVNTLDGRNTFHAMGGIMCVTPSSAFSAAKTIQRLKNIPSAETIGKFGFIDVMQFEKKNSAGLQSIIVENVDGENYRPIDLTFTDILWLYSKNKNPNATPGWNGFMQNIKHSDDYATSKILPLPFVNAPPSDMNTIFTVLIEASRRTMAENQEVCVVTFDQPLYYKAKDIITSIDPRNDPYNLRFIFVRLGGFHMLMSFLGSIGFIMDCSGLKEAFGTIFAENSAEKALNGHAFSRAVRGHILVQVALANVIFSYINFDAYEKLQLDRMLQEIENPYIEHEILKNNASDLLSKKFKDTLQYLQTFGPTACLWIQYFTLINIMKRFIEAERCGNWELHLSCVRDMIPYFYASGHYLYGKSSQLNKYWSGIWSDMTIEQVLMKSMKSAGGLTHGRGISDSVLCKWILSSIILTEISNEMENFCNVCYSTSEQHVDAGVSRIKRDASDLDKLVSFFSTYDPFPASNTISSIYSGVVGNESINCHQAAEVGTQLLHNTIGKSFASLKSVKKNRVQTLRSVHTYVKVHDEKIEINPLLIFQRIALNIKTKTDMKQYLKYELAPMPLSIFDDSGMRKTQKSLFYDNFNAIQPSPIFQNCINVIDGGFFIHKVVWTSNKTVSQILGFYTLYAENHFTKNSVFIFDGYPDNLALSTKSVERMRRQIKQTGREINFDLNTNITCPKEKFFSNEKNKKNFIFLLAGELQKLGFTTDTAQEDADTLIISTAIQLQKDNQSIVKIIGEDTDLLVLLMQLAPTNQDIYFCKPGKGQESEKVYNCNSFKYPGLINYVALLYIITGCDTTSCFYKKGKNKILKIFKDENEENLQKFDIFYDKKAKHKHIAKTGCEIISSIYSSQKNDEQLNELRYLLFEKSTAKSSFHLGNLPPTEGAATQHVYRTYHQLQTWLGYESDPQKWGWKVVANTLEPIYSCDPMIPENIIKRIACRCESGCKSNNCGCKKHGLKCSNICLRCTDENCSNMEDELLIMDSDDDINELNGEDTTPKANSDTIDNSVVIDNDDNIDELCTKRRKLC